MFMGRRLLLLWESQSSAIRQKITPSTYSSMTAKKDFGSLWNYLSLLTTLRGPRSPLMEFLKSGLDQRQVNGWKLVPQARSQQEGLGGNSGKQGNRFAGQSWEIA